MIGGGRNTVANHGTNAAFGERRLIHTYTFHQKATDKDGNEITKPMQRKVLANEFSWYSYERADEMVRKLSAGFQQLMNEHGPEQGSDTPRHMGIYAATSMWWQLSAQGAFRSGIPLVTVYNSLGRDGLAFACFNTESTILICDTNFLPVVADVINGYDAEENGVPIQCDLRQLKCIITVEAHSEGEQEHVDRIRGRDEQHGGPVQVMTLEEVQQLGEDAMNKDSVEDTPPTPDSTAVIMFTSGSTGLPKGVVIKHRNLVAGVAGIGSALPSVGNCRGIQDVYLAYLPLAHVLELVAENILIAHGGAIGYGSPFTLTNASPMIPQSPDEDDHVPPTGVQGDAPTLRPTILACVPAVMDRIRKAVTGKFERKGGAAAFIFNEAFRSKVDQWLQNRPTPFLDGVLFDKIRTQALGGRVRIMVSGGGPLSPETQLFMNVVFNCPVGQGYGLTETCGGGTVYWPGDHALGWVGGPITSNDIKLVDWDEGGYTTRPNERSPNPQGEVWISGDNVAAGYYKLEDKTNESFVEDDSGRKWFLTGDIGEFNPQGMLKIIDRKKDLVKLSHGEYIALGQIETVAKLASVVTNFAVYADSSKDHCVALAVVNPDALPEPYCNYSENELIGNKDVGKIVQQEVANLGKLDRRKREIPARVAVVGTQEWLPPSGLVTASMKLRRAVIYREFARELEELYADEDTEGAALPARQQPAKGGSGSGAGTGAPSGPTAPVDVEEGEHSPARGAGEGKHDEDEKDGDE